MCGIAGLIGWSGTKNQTSEIIKKIQKSLHHRGPDNRGSWISKEDNVLFIHTRLSILDLTSGGNQPMKSFCGRYIICFNGEIYNHLKLREYLKKHKGNISWKSSSDTETLLMSISLLGLNNTLKKIRGMFSFSLFDIKSKKIHLVRDRFGEKPLYLLKLSNNIFAFSSEISSFENLSEFIPSLDLSGVACYFQRGYIAAPLSIWKNVKKIMPGTQTELSLGKDRRYYISKEVNYWSIKEIAINGQLNTYQGTYENCKIKLEKILVDVLEGQKLSDVPLGVFLSGGIDSSIVAALMQKLSSKRVKTFSIGFNETMYDESCFAEAVAKHLNTEHITLKVQPNDALNLIEKMPKVYSEPFADSSQIPTTLLSSLVRNHVTVALSGDGGDEIFSGYSRYLFAHRTSKFIFNSPYFLRNNFAKFMRIFPPGLLNEIGIKLNLRKLGDKIYKASDILISKDLEEFYDKLTSYWPQLTIFSEINNIKYNFQSSLGDIENMMLSDQLNYLPNDILVKVDRASMSESLETRAPLLDHVLAEFMWSTPLEWRLNRQGGKRILKDLLYNYVPKKLIDRPKQGFGLPVNEWIRGPLKEWALELMDKQNLPDDGLINGRLARKTLDEHLKNNRNWDYRLWPILMWQQWNISKGFF